MLFYHEVLKYSLAIARGVGKTIASYEIISALGSVAAYCAPELTAAVYAGAISIVTPIAITACAIGTLMVVFELEYLAELYMTDQVACQQEWEKVKKFAGQFYNFDQAPQAHVENIAQCATTFAWPIQREAIFNSLMGMHKVCCNLYTVSGKMIQRAGKVTTNQLHRAQEFANSNQFDRLKIDYEKIFDTTIFSIRPQPAYALAQINNACDSLEQAALSHIFKNESSHGAEKVATAIIAKVTSSLVEKSESQVTQKTKELAVALTAQKIDQEGQLQTIKNIIAGHVSTMPEIIRQAQIVSDFIAQLHEINQEQVAIFQASIKPCLKINEIVNIEALKAIEGVDQVNQFRDFTNNFTNLEKLQPEEFLYLNLCIWLDPKEKVINLALKDRGGIDIIDPQSKKILAHYEKYDLYHSLLSEMRPGSIRDHTHGGHLFIPELRVAMVEISEIEHIADGFFDMKIKRGSNRKRNTIFPMGTSVEQAVEILEDTIKNIQEVVEFKIISPTKTSIKITKNNKYGMHLNILEDVARFYPTKHIE